MNTAKSRPRRRDNGNGTETMLTIREVCQLLHVHSNTLRRWANQGLLKAYRIGPRGDRRFTAEDVSALVIAQTRFGPTDAGK